MFGNLGCHAAGRARYKRKKADQAAAAAEQSHDVPQSREDADKEAKRLKRCANVWCHCTALTALWGQPHSCWAGGARVYGRVYALIAVFSVCTCNAACEVLSAGLTGPQDGIACCVSAFEISICH